MNYKALLLTALICCVFYTAGSAQTTAAYDNTNSTEGKGLFDKSRFQVNHLLSFGMSTASSITDLKSQGLYTTMIAYQISKPLTLDLNFSLPIFSSYNSSQNLNINTIQSLEYFKNMPFDATLTWQPKENFAMQLSVIRNVATYPYYDSPFYSPFGNPNTPLHLRRW